MQLYTDSFFPQQTLCFVRVNLNIFPFLLVPCTTRNVCSFFIAATFCDKRSQQQLAHCHIFIQIYSCCCPLYFHAFNFYIMSILTPTFQLCRSHNQINSKCVQYFTSTSSVTVVRLSVCSYTLSIVYVQLL